jgi:hypothetical protein
MESGGKCGEIVENQQMPNANGKSSRRSAAKTGRHLNTLLFQHGSMLACLQSKGNLSFSPNSVIRESTVKLSLLKQYKDIQREACGSLNWPRIRENISLAG